MSTQQKSMVWLKASNYDELSQIGANIFIEQLQQKPESILGFATGGTPEGLYAQLVRSYQNGEVTFDKATGFNLDEYIGIDSKHSASYHYYMQKKLYSHVNIDRKNIYLPTGNADQSATEQYEALIKQVGGIDLLLLGIGVNGHIGFNEPGTPFTQTTHIVDLAESTIQANKRFFKNIDEVPRKAITMGIATILQAKKIVLLISGSSKQQAFDQLRAGVISEDFPASALHMHNNVIIIYSEVK